MPRPAISPVERSHGVGFTGVDDKGQEGIELAFESALAGKPGSRRVVKDRRGNVVEDVQSIRLPQDGREVALAIDNKIQYLAHAALKQAMLDHKAKAGGVVVVGSAFAVSDFADPERLAGRLPRPAVAGIDPAELALQRGARTVVDAGVQVQDLHCVVHVVFLAEIVRCCD